MNSHSDEATCRCDFVNRWLDQHEKYFAPSSRIPKATTFSQYVYGRQERFSNEPLYYMKILPASRKLSTFKPIQH
ncbi:hypothetical protein B5X24_HaOG216432 [Helicoverpa armigera]|nr:hypothetical protein B5X24_HaOG216432 [Helicoverpa armigera]